MRRTRRTCRTEQNRTAERTQNAAERTQNGAENPHCKGRTSLYPHSPRCKVWLPHSRRPGVMVSPSASPVARFPASRPFSSSAIRSHKVRSNRAPSRLALFAVVPPRRAAGLKEFKRADGFFCFIRAYTCNFKWYITPDAIATRNAFIAA